MGVNLYMPPLLHLLAGVWLPAAYTYTAHVNTLIEVVNQLYNNLSVIFFNRIKSFNNTD